MKNWNIDLGDEQIKETPFAERKSISILLGAGFSAPSPKSYMFIKKQVIKYGSIV